MKGKDLIFCCLILILFASFCKSKGRKDPIIVIDIEDNVNNMKRICLSQFSDNIRYVALESNPNFLLSMLLYEFDISDNYILCYDGRKCALYDIEGHFIRPIGSEGRGPGEYTGISALFLRNGKIYIHDFYTDDILEYKEDGVFLKRYQSGYTGNGKYRLENAIMINDSLIFGNIVNRTGREEYKALIMDKNGEIKYYWKNHIFFKLAPGVKQGTSTRDALFSKTGNGILFMEYFNDTLFLLDDQYHLKPLYVFNFGKYKEPLSERGKRLDQIDRSSYMGIYQIFTKENYLILKCDFNKYFPAKRLTPEIIKLPGIEEITRWHNTRIVIGIYDKITEKLVFSEPTSTDNHLLTSGLYNDIDAGPRFIPDKMINDSTMVMNIRFEYLIEHIESKDFKDNTPRYPEKKKRLESFVDSLSRTGFDNPVLMFVTFKAK